MEQRVFSVYDSKTEAYMRPFYALTVGEAVRIFVDAVGDKTSMFSRHPGDFTLFEIGKFDDAVGTLDSVPPVNLGCAITFVDGAEDA